MSRSKQFIISLILGLGIGIAVPVIIWLWPSVSFSPGLPETVNEPAAEQVLLQQKYHLVLNNSLLSVVEGGIGESGNPVITGVDTSAWPQDLLKVLSQIEFKSIDEAQSFLDTISEPLWIEQWNGTGIENNR